MSSPTKLTYNLQNILLSNGVFKKIKSNNSTNYMYYVHWGTVVY